MADTLDMLNRAGRPRLFVDVQHGLCNRLRALVSGAAMARATGRQLVVVWVPDMHCDARLRDLIDYPGPVLETTADAALAQACAAQVISYMENEPGNVFGQPVLEDDTAPAQGDVYIRSAYSLVSPHHDLAAEQPFLRALVPAAPVRALIAPVRRPNAVALHIRMGTGPDFDHLPWEAPDNWPAARHAELVEWRDKSHMRHFVTRLDALIAAGQADTVFLAADLPGTYAAFAERYGPRVTWLARDLYDRSARQLQYALADLILLTAADLFLASTWSSFSDLAQRLARPKRALELSGTDF